MKTMFTSLLLCLTMALPLSMFSQSGIIVNYTAKNHSAEITSVSDGSLTQVLNNVGESAIFTYRSGLPSSITFGHNYTIYYGWTYYSLSTSIISILPYGTPFTLFDDGCTKMVITRLPGYSVPGATYNIVLNLESYQYCF